MTDPTQEQGADEQEAARRYAVTIGRYLREAFTVTTLDPRAVPSASELEAAWNAYVAARTALIARRR